jgi:hypothetical protein
MLAIASAPQAEKNFIESKPASSIGRSAGNINPVVMP